MHEKRNIYSIIEKNKYYLALFIKTKMRGLEGKVYDSKGEAKIAEILKKYGLDFDYEKQVLVEDKKNNKIKTRLWYPDFYLKGHGIIIEYIGMTHDKNYMEGVKARKKTYDEMGLKVVYVYSNEIWEQDKHTQNYHLKRDFELNLIRKLQKEIDSKDNPKLRNAHLYTNASSAHDYSRSRMGYC